MDFFVNRKKIKKSIITSKDLEFSETIDPLMKAVAQGGVQLSKEDKADLKAFLLSLSDPGFINNPDFQEPN